MCLDNNYRNIYAIKVLSCLLWVVKEFLTHRDFSQLFFKFVLVFLTLLWTLFPLVCFQ